MMSNQQFNNLNVEGLVTTIIPVYNRSGMLKEAVASVLAQTYRPIEIIIVDDGSTDDTARVADELSARYPGEIRVIHQANTGPGLAREAGRLLARGEFIQYLDSDDILLPKKFELQVGGLRNHPECGVSYGWTRFCMKGISTDITPWKRTGEKIVTMFPSFLESRWWGTSTPLYRRAVIDRTGAWTALTNEEDWEYDCRIAAQGIFLDYVPEFISEEHDHAGARLSREGAKDAKKLQQRASAHDLILRHARQANVPVDSQEMQHFARELFLLCRQCGAAGLPQESRRLFDLARQASGQLRGNCTDFKFYGILAGMVGWTIAGKIARFIDRFR